MGYPVLHNAQLVSDLGYYYEGFNVSEGSKQLDEILSNHDSKIEDYVNKNKKAIYRYHGENKDLIDAYDLLIENLFKGNDENKKLIYDSQINNFKF